ncbi:hypothetical protein AX16_001537 [Volvariella volvacea WC 439]|nr:hypothetical protein AX16_001537 [Volvariella volvacea WC 439]
MLSRTFVLLGLQLGVYATQQTALAAATPSTWPSQQDWDNLGQQVQGRLFPGAPLAEPCFSQGFDSSACSNVRVNYGDEVYRAHQPGGYIQTQWETCQTTGEQCLLNYQNPNDTSPTVPPNTCRIGSIAQYYIDVQTPDDVAAAFEFSRRTNVPLVIKNTGHDYIGRSSAPGSLALWTHNLKDISYDPEFVPEGCSTASPGVTMGAGVQWNDAYAFADQHNITLVGGSDRSVGAVGGWLQGGGHGALSNTMGLGVDRVLQYKVVTPDGTLRIANSCQNQDLFFALRGGGGGTFGVVLEATVLASPPVTLQTLILTFRAPPGDRSLTQRLWTVLTDNQLRWADEGWGGFSTSQIAILVNPVMGQTEARESLQPMIELGEQFKAEGVENVQLIVTEFPSWAAFFTAFTADHVAAVGQSLALASRLIPKSSFSTPSSRFSLVSSLLATQSTTPSLIILITAPTSYQPLPGPEGRTSVTEAWRDAVYHITVVSPWNWNATAEEKVGAYRRVGEAIDHLREITPDAAYVNEADVYEPNWQESFWGSNYDELLEIKQKYDPDHLLDCWHCVGWQPTSSRFSCYVDVSS